MEGEVKGEEEGYNKIAQIPRQAWWRPVSGERGADGGGGGRCADRGGAGEGGRWLELCRAGGSWDVSC
eukprot:COSAG01_NODE_11772_length_1861_cov_48.015323_1_plen_68_part_00